MSRPIANLLVVDLDDTLWRWFDAWFESFRALLDSLMEMTGLSEDELTAAIRPIHQERGTSEYSWLIDELSLLEKYVPHGRALREYFDPALHAQNKARKAATALYPGVLDTLQAIRGHGTKVVAYTESLEFWTRWRIQQTGLDGILDELYSSPDHDAPVGVNVKERRTLAEDNYRLNLTTHLHVPPGIIKPDSEILTQIIDDHRVSAHRTVYVGDSLIKDVAMAQSVGAIDIWAKYGVQNGDPRYALLQKVSHWPEVTVKKEITTKAGDQVTPRFTLERSFAELTDIIAFEPTEMEQK